MAILDYVDRIKAGAAAWNDWKQHSPEVRYSSLDLTGCDLSNAQLSGIDLYGVNLYQANLRDSDLTGADLRETDLRDSDISGSKLREADMRLASLQDANLSAADLRSANIGMVNARDANFRNADFAFTRIVDAQLNRADFSGANVGGTIFAETDLSTVIGLDTCSHEFPSTVGIDTLFLSRGQISEAFLRGCGVPEQFITYARSLVGKAIEFYSCFISYSTKDQEFADRLYADLQNRAVRCWFAPHDIQSGRKVHEQIDEAIRVYDRLLLILSEHSMSSSWVETEISKARRRELHQKRQMLFPVRLVSFEALQDWECFDAGTGKDSAKEIREYFIPDFSNWKNHDSYEQAFDRLLRDLKAKPESSPGTA